MSEEKKDGDVPVWAAVTAWIVTPIVVLAIMIPAAVWQGYVMAYLWQAFVEPMGAAVPHVSWARFIGIDMLLAILRPSPPYPEDRKHPIAEPGLLPDRPRAARAAGGDPLGGGVVVVLA